MKASDALTIEGKTIFEAIHVRKPSGAIMINGEHVADTMSCKHCGYTWIPIKGSGKVRGWCNKCDGPTCGSSRCMDCLPQEKRLDLYEKGKIILL